MKCCHSRSIGDPQAWKDVFYSGLRGFNIRESFAAQVKGFIYLHEVFKVDWSGASLCTSSTHLHLRIRCLFSSCLPRVDSKYCSQWVKGRHIHRAYLGSPDWTFTCPKLMHCSPCHLQIVGPRVTKMEADKSVNQTQERTCQPREARYQVRMCEMEHHF